MAWTTFPTLTDGQVLTGAHMQIVRDNFAETAPAKATTAGSLFVATGSNAIAQRTIGSTFTAATENTTNTSYVDLATAGPAVTVTTGTSAIVMWSAHMWNDTAGSRPYMSYAVSGATTIAAGDAIAYAHDVSAAGRIIGASRIMMQAGLTGGSNTFTAKYRVSANTGTWAQRHLMVIPL